MPLTCPHSYLRSSRIYKDKRDEQGLYHFTIGSAGAVS